MGIGQVLSDTFGMVKARFGPLLGLWAIYFALMIGVYIVFLVGIAGMAGVAVLATTATSDPLAAGAGVIVTAILFFIGYLLVAMAQYASLITMASPLKQVTVGEALGAGWRAAPALLLLMIVLFIAYLVGGLAVGLVGTVFSVLGDWGSGLFAILLIPVVVWLGCRLSLLFSVIAVDEVRNPIKAIARSWNLTRGHALKIFLVSLVFMLILLVLCGLALLPSLGLIMSMADPTAFAEGGPAAGSAVGGILLLIAGIFVVSVLYNLAYCAFLAVIHGTLSDAAGEGAAEAFA